MGNSLFPYRARPSDGVAWVTGASSGIGRATALELARRGYKVAVTARREDDLVSLAKEAEGLGVIIPAPADITDAAALKAAVARIEAEHGPIVLAFLNAGLYIPVGIFPIDIPAFQKIFDVNVMGTFHSIAAVLPGMVERGRGQIGITASVAGYGGLPRSAAYGASKAALINLAQAMTFDCAAKGVSVQMFNPGFIETPATAPNTFSMPFLMPVDEAARRVCNGFESGGFEVTFPRRFALILKLINALPYAAYLRVMGQATK